MTLASHEAVPSTPVVVKGHPSVAEVAALTAVLAVLRRERDRPHTPSNATLAGGWKSYWYTVRNPVVPGREAWRSSFRL